jgi:nicotinate-nucleotide adenylyltransferase
VKKKYGIFGGTFDPVHVGHIAMAIALKEAYHLDHIFFIPAQINPLKKNRPLASSKDRVHMLKLALRGIPDCSILTLELKRSGPSYMIDTIRALKKKYPKADFYLLLGEDVLSQITKWKDVHELFELAPPVIARRPGCVHTGKWKRDKMLAQAIQKGFRADVFVGNVSSTDVRKRLKRGLFCSHVVHQDVLKYIKRKKLYV